MFLNLHSLGHETADVGVEKCLESLEKDTIDSYSLIALSQIFSEVHTGSKKRIEKGL